MQVSAISLFIITVLLIHCCASVEVNCTDKNSDEGNVQKRHVPEKVEEVSENSEVVLQCPENHYCKVEVDSENGNDPKFVRKCFAFPGNKLCVVAEKEGKSIREGSSKPPPPPKRCCKEGPTINQQFEKVLKKVSDLQNRFRLVSLHMRRLEKMLGATTTKNSSLGNDEKLNLANQSSMLADTSSVEVGTSEDWKEIFDLRENYDRWLIVAIIIGLFVGCYYLGKWVWVQIQSWFLNTPRRPMGDGSDVAAETAMHVRGDPEHSNVEESGVTLSTDV